MNGTTASTQALHAGHSILNPWSWQNAYGVALQASAVVSTEPTRWPL